MNTNNRISIMTSLKEIFANNSQKPRENLFKLILARIENEKRRMAKIRLIYSGVAGGVSIVALVPMVKFFISDFLQSGFWNYFSLIFSDSGAVLSYWKELGLSLLESLPVLSSAVVLVLVLILLMVGRSAIHNTKLILRNQNQLTF